ncbi:MAG: hypothetical protein GX094_08965 [Clostridiales bacterium]|nr:hypothetical protein [Clostridiales bacterium]
MRSTRIVFILIGILVYAPIVLLQGKAVYRQWKEGQRRKAWFRSGATIAMCVVLLLFIISLYQFTLGYQVPLVMERVMVAFTQKLEQNMDMDQYRQLLLESDVIDTEFQAIDENDLEQAGFKKGQKYTISIGEQAFDSDNGDSVVMYALHKSGESSIYTAVEFKLYQNKWRAVKHWIVDEEKQNEISSMKYFAIKR